jgi:DNA-binding MarR family transcriptional regulator
MRFSELIPFLMHGIVTNSVAHATEEFAEMGLNVAEARVLVGLMQNPGIRVGHLSDLTSIAQSTLSHLLRRLGRQGLLRRTRVSEDNRSVVVELTGAGGRKAQTCWRLAQLQDQMIVEALTSAKAEEFRKLLQEVYQSLAPPHLRQASVDATISPTQRGRGSARRNRQ